MKVTDTTLYSSTSVTPNGEPLSSSLKFQTQHDLGSTDKAAGWPTYPNTSTERVEYIQEAPGRYIKAPKPFWAPPELPQILVDLEQQRVERATGTPTNSGSAAQDVVNHPKHYTSHPSGIECIDVIEHMPFNIGAAVKYLWRVDLKDGAIENLEKARWYVDREIKKRKSNDSAA